MRIQNRDALAHTPLRAQALAVIEAGFAAIDTDAVVRRNVAIHNDSLSVGDKSFPLKDIRRLIVVGVGKCASEAAYTLEQLLGDRIDEGIVLDVHRKQHTHLNNFSAIVLTKVSYLMCSAVPDCSTLPFIKVRIRSRLVRTAMQLNGSLHF